LFSAFAGLMTNKDFELAAHESSKEGRKKIAGMKTYSSMELSPLQGDSPLRPDSQPGSEFVLEMLPQPDDETCGVTCLHALYRFYGLEVDLTQLIKEVRTLETVGTLA